MPRDQSGTGNELTGNNTIVGNAGNNKLEGSAGNDVLSGIAGNDTLFGGAGDDFLDGFLSVADMTGGAGNDVYAIDGVSDKVTEAAGQGIDTIQTSISFDMALDGANVERHRPHLQGHRNQRQRPQQRDLRQYRQRHAIWWRRQRQADRVSAVSIPLLGGTGNDIYVVGNKTDDTVIEDLNEGIDLVLTHVSYTLTANVENLILTENGNVDGSGNQLANTITGNGGDNELFGSGGNDLLSGGAGNDGLDGGIGSDTMKGGAGDDIYLVDSVGDIVSEGAGQGIDVVLTTLDRYTLGANVENLFMLVGSAAVAATGNALADRLSATTTATSSTARPATTCSSATTATIR